VCLPGWFAGQWQRYRQGAAGWLIQLVDLTSPTFASANYAGFSLQIKPVCDYTLPIS
jgi:hypothetical protein